MELKSLNLNEILQMMPIGIITTDCDFNIQFLNEKASTCIPFTNHLSQCAIPAFQTFINKRKKGMLSLTLFEPHPCDIEIEMLPMSEGFLFTFHDITALKQLELLVRRSNRMMELGELAAMVAHDIRNPLGGIKGFASLLERDLSDRPEIQRMATAIVSGADKLDRLVTQILEYSRPLNPKFATHSLNRVLSELQTTIREEHPSPSSHDVQTQLPETPCRAIIDPELFTSALYNLVLNGFQAMPDGGVVTINLQEEEKTWKITVSDHGEGIPPHNLDKIFSPIFTTKPQGNGFGLAEVHKVVTAHHGTIAVDSTVNIGATFTIHIPKKVSHGY